MGLLLPENETKAFVRRALLKETTTDELLELLLHAPRHFRGAPTWYTDAEMCKLLAAESGLEGAS